MPHCWPRDAGHNEPAHRAPAARADGLVKRTGLGKNNDGSLQPLACDLIEKQERRGLECSLDRSVPSPLPIVVLPDGLQPPRPAPPVVANAVRRLCPTMRVGVSTLDYMPVPSRVQQAESATATAAAAASASSAAPAETDGTSNNVESVSMIAPANATFVPATTRLQPGAPLVPPPAAPNSFNTRNNPVPSASACGASVAGPKESSVAASGS